MSEPMTDRTYPAAVHRVVDADTLIVDIDLGFDVVTSQTVRVVGINAPEKNTPAGKAAIGWAEAWVARLDKTLWPVVVVGKTERDKYGRRLCDIVPNAGPSYATAIVAAGHAVAWDGKGKRPDASA